TWRDLYAPTPCSAMVPSNVERPNGSWSMGASGPFPRPISSHTYDMLAVPPRLDELVVVSRLFNGGTCSKAGNDVGGRIAHFARNTPVDVFALKRDRADPSKSIVEHVTTSGPSSPHGEPGYDYDATNRIIGGAVHDSTFYAFDPPTRTWTAHAMNGGKPGAV